MESPGLAPGLFFVACCQIMSDLPLIGTLFLRNCQAAQVISRMLGNAPT